VILIEQLRIRHYSILLYVCIYLSIYLCMHVCMYVAMYVRLSVRCPCELPPCTWFHPQVVVNIPRIHGYILLHSKSTEIFYCFLVKKINHSVANLASYCFTCGKSHGKVYNTTASWQSAVLLHDKSTIASVMVNIALWVTSAHALVC